jgi:hypothetical protein
MGDIRSAQMNKRMLRTGVGADLVYDGLVLGPVKDGLEVLGPKVADANALQFSLVLQILENPP